MSEVMLKTHLIITDITNEYDINWCGSIMDSKPLFKNNMPVFIIISSNHRTELNTINMAEIERVAKILTKPRGRSAITTDKAYIYIKEENLEEKLLGIVTHNKIKTYAPMFDPFEYE